MQHVHALCMATIAASVAPCLPAVAQDAVTQAEIQKSDPDHGSRLSATLGVDWVSAYFFRGYLQEDSGLIVQPYAEIGIALIEPTEDGGVGLAATFGTWNSFHSEQTGSTQDGVESWYESDAYVSLTLTADRFSIGVGYTFYMYPNSDFNTVQELGLVFAYDIDDESFAGKVLGDPSVGVYIETDNSNVASDEAAYLEVAWGPSFDVLEGKATVSVPMSIGLSLDDYYTDTFGYFSAGLAVEVPVHDGEWGSVALTFGGTVLVLGNGVDDVNDGDEVDGYAYAGISIGF